MNSTELDDIFRLLSEYTIEMDPDSRNEDLLCIICKKIMKDACYGVCGCRYCHACICDYLREPDRYCPGGRSTCNEEYLSMDIDVKRSERLNNKIINSIVLCPYRSCNSKMELKHTREHLRVCTQSLIKCPYAPIGCDNAEEAKEYILTHLNDCTLHHAGLLFECIETQKNELNRLTNNVEMSKLEILALKEESRIKEIQIREIIEQAAVQRRVIIEQMSQQKREIIAQLMEENRKSLEKMMEQMARVNEESRNKENRILVLEAQLNNMRTEMKIHLPVANTEIRSLKGSLDDHRGKIDLVKNDMRMESTNMRKEFDNFKKEMTKMQIDFKKLIDNRDRQVTYWIKWNTLCPSCDVDFLWKIDELTNVMEIISGDDICSESFYSNNYKMCLSLGFDKTNSNIDLNCMIMKGDKDDEVQWPMAKAVTLSILDQETLRAYKTVTRQYKTYTTDKSVFDKPTNDMNKYGIGELLINYSSIKAIPSVTLNNSIVVTCSLSDP